MKNNILAESIDIQNSSSVYNVKSTFCTNPKFSGQFNIITKGNDLTATYSVYIKEVIYNDPATIVLWSDGTKTVSKCAEGDIYSAESGLSICVLKKLAGSTTIHDLFNDWLPTTGNRVSLRNIRAKHKNK